MVRKEYRIKTTLNSFCHRKILKNIAFGVYTFNNISWAWEDLLLSKYIFRLNNHIGFYYGQSFGYILGISCVPPIRYIVSNSEKLLHGRKKNVYGFCLRIKGSKVSVNNDNYNILAVLDFLNSYWKYTKVKRDVIISSVIKFSNQNNITYSLLKQHMSYYNWSQNKIIYEVLRSLE